MMLEYCPFTEGLACSQNERMDEFYSQMQDALLQNRSIAFITGGKCPAWADNCMKLQEYKELLQKQR